MNIHILHSGLVSRTGPTDDRSQFDAGRYAFSVITASRWGRDDYLMQGGHSQHSPDVIIAHSSVFQFDVLRMLRFILSSKARAPWIVYVLLLSTDEMNEVVSLPTLIRDHFSRYFQISGSQFTLHDIHEYLNANIQKIEDLVVAKRRQFFETEIVSRDDLDQRIARTREIEYEFALSFSGAQRTQARDLANVLKGRGCEVFFDEFETTSIVGKNLTEELYTVYSTKSRYCVMLVSEEYKSGPWTNQERRAALDKAINDSGGTYIIPIKIHDVVLPGLSTSIAYLKWQSNPTELADILYRKLVADMVGQSAQQVPHAMA